MNTLERALVFGLSLVFYAASAGAAAEESLRYGAFGEVALVGDKSRATAVALFVSGDEGWMGAVVDAANALAAGGTLVVGIDLPRLRSAVGTGSSSCFYPAGDFEQLSHFVQKKLGLPSYLVPVLVGYGAGGTLVYATHVQAPPGTFRGALSLGFCPQLSWSRSFCPGHGLRAMPERNTQAFLAAPELEVPWFVLQGGEDATCLPSAVDAFVRQTRQAELIVVPGAGHAVLTDANALAQLVSAFRRLASRREPEPRLPEAVQDLPLIEVPARTADGELFAVIVSGDGGWANIDRDLARVMADQGIGVVGLNSLQYFWTERTPEGAANDLERILAHYQAAWGRAAAILIGYSRGADVVPFMVTRLPSDRLARVRKVVLLAPSRTAEFHFHIMDWIGSFSRKHAYPVPPEIEKLGRLLSDARVLCFYGSNEIKESAVSVPPGTSLMRAAAT